MTYQIEITSFGFYFGYPPGDADLQYDLRRPFHDPAVVAEIRNKTAFDPCIRTVVMNTPGIKELISAIVATVEAYLHGPCAENNPLRVTIGCRHGRHRAPTTAMALKAILTTDMELVRELGLEELARNYEGRSFNVNLTHRDIDKR